MLESFDGFWVIRPRIWPKQPDPALSCPWPVLTGVHPGVGTVPGRAVRAPRTRSAVFPPDLQKSRIVVIAGYPQKMAASQSSYRTLLACLPLSAPSSPALGPSYPVCG